MSKVFDTIKIYYPKIDDMPFCTGLRDGKFTRVETLRAEVVELYHALNTRELIQDGYKKNLRVATATGVIIDDALATTEEVIDHEDKTEEQIDFNRVRTMLDRTFATSRGYGWVKKLLAESNQPLETPLVRSKAT